MEGPESQSKGQKPHHNPGMLPSVASIYSVCTCWLPQAGCEYHKGWHCAVFCCDRLSEGISCG